MESSRVRSFSKKLLSLLGFALVSALLAGMGQPDDSPVCPERMTEIDGYCVDLYEYPNFEGARPLVGLSAIPEHADKAAGRVMDAETLCAEQGKRLCSREEWIKACQGTSPSSCNTDKKWLKPREDLVAARDPKEFERLDQREDSGAAESCESHTGAFDMLGNVEEWVTCEDGVDGYCLMGRFWADARDCTFTVRAHSGRWHYYETGARCCTDLAEDD